MLAFFVFSVADDKKKQSRIHKKRDDSGNNNKTDQEGKRDIEKKYLTEK